MFEGLSVVKICPSLCMVSDYEPQSLTRMATPAAAAAAELAGTRQTIGTSNKNKKY